MLESDITADCLFSACSAIAQGILPEAASNLLSSSRLIAIPKPNSDVRPIAIGECIRRLTARALCVQMKAHFAMTQKTFSLVLGHDSADLPWEQVSLPVRLGGFGMLSLSTTSRPAFVASWIHSVVELPLRFPGLIPIIDNLIQRPSGLIGKSLSKSLPPDKVLARPKKLQHRLSHELYTFQSCE